MKLRLALLITILFLTITSMFQNYVLYKQHVLIKDMLKNPSCLTQPPHTFDGDQIPNEPKEQ